MGDRQKSQSRGLLIPIWLLVFLVAGYIFWQASGISSLDEVLPNPEKTLALACMKEHEGRFQYPDTLELVKYTKVSSRIYVTVTAENGFGVPGREEVHCPLKDGAIDESALLREEVDRLLDN